MYKRQKETFLSQLEKNQDVKNILLSESPWVLEATTEAAQQARIATLFDINPVSYTHLDPIETYVDGDWVKAKGTTLGADNGLGVAAIMARCV